MLGKLLLQPVILLLQIRDDCIQPFKFSVELGKLLLEVLSATFVLVIISNSLVVEALQLLEFLQ